MNAYNYQLNANDAREGSGGGNHRIHESGAYIGVLTKAKHIVATTGAVGVECEFESKAGEQARFTLYTHNKSGEVIYGCKQLQALMAVLKLRDIRPQLATIEEYDFDTRQVAKVQAEIFPDLMNRPVGIVFQIEEYLNGSGEVKQRPNFYAPYNAETSQLAIELLDQEPAKKLEKILQNLQDKKLPAQTRPPATSIGSGNIKAPGAHKIPDFDDDIPF
ncbi:hypothetical protein [Microbulbifer sp. TYP-18]|uniref:hypothetical protein n=1 Tax=Microbulbifer sp. TYP-18 TaxID=3230024 RepID=UPI0034C6689A